MEELAGAGGNDEGHVSVTENGELTRLLHQPHAALAEGHLPVTVILDALDLYLAAPHLSSSSSSASSASVFFLLLSVSVSQNRPHDEGPKTNLTKCPSLIDPSTAECRD